MKPKKPIESLIPNIRNQKVILDADLAELYGVPTYRFNEAFKRNRQRFPETSGFKCRSGCQSRRCRELIANCDEFRH